MIMHKATKYMILSLLLSVGYASAGITFQAALTHAKLIVGELPLEDQQRLQVMNCVEENLYSNLDHLTFDLVTQVVRVVAADALPEVDKALVAAPAPAKRVVPTKQIHGKLTNADLKKFAQERERREKGGAKNPVIAEQERLLRQFEQVKRNNNSKPVKEEPMSELLAQLGTVNPIESVQQDGNTCGSWSLANAKAIQNLIEKGCGFKDLTAKAIQAEARKIFEEYNDPSELYNDQIEFFATQLEGLKLPYFFVLTREMTDTGVRQIVCKNQYLHDIAFETNKANKTDFFRLYQQQLKELKKALSQNYNAQAIHFICNLGGHWVLVSIVKPKGEAARLIAMNSSNAPWIGEATEEFITHIHFAFFDGPQEYLTAQSVDPELEQALLLSMKK